MRPGHCRSTSQALAGFLVLTLTLGAGQTPAGGPGWSLEIPTAVTDVVMHQRTVREPIAKVTDKNNKPVAGAAVTFLIIPNGGAGATFPGGQLSMTVQTDAQGLARGVGMQHNGVAGNYQVQVSALHDGQVQTKQLRYRNVKKHTAKYWSSVAAILLVAATVSTVAAKRGDSANPEITVGPGTVRR